MTHQPWLLFDSTSLQAHRAHDGLGQVESARVLSRTQGSLAFVDHVVVPVGTSVGEHTHGGDEELYVIVSGEAEAVVDGELRVVGPGDVVHNRAGGSHALRNHGPAAVMMVVVDVRVSEDGNGNG
jgi:quercetin dioxygenase-like cupin family protein